MFLSRLMKFLWAIHTFCNSPLGSHQLSPRNLMLLNESAGPLRATSGLHGRQLVFKTKLTSYGICFWGYGHGACV